MPEQTAESNAKRAQRLRGVLEETSQLLSALRDRRRSLRWVPEPGPSHAPELWRALLEKQTIRELEQLWRAHVDLAWRVRQHIRADRDGERGRESDEIYHRHYDGVGFSQPSEAELARIEAVLFLRWQEWDGRTKQTLSHRYGTSRPRVKRLTEIAQAAACTLGGALSVPDLRSSRPPAVLKKEQELDSRTRPSERTVDDDPAAALYRTGCGPNKGSRDSLGE